MMSSPGRMNENSSLARRNEDKKDEINIESEESSDPESTYSQIIEKNKDMKNTI